MKQNNPWERAEVDEDRLKDNRFVHPEKEQTPDTPEKEGKIPEQIRGVNFMDITNSYKLISARTYSQGVNALRNKASDPHPYITHEGNKIIRPLTLSENIESAINNYETLTDSNRIERSEEDRLKLINCTLDSCTGIAYKVGTMRFKIIPECKELILINKDFNPYIPVDYDSLQGIELHVSKGKYNEYDLLTKEEVLKHPAWRAAVEDGTLLKAYADIIFNSNKSVLNLLRKSRAMGFWIKVFCVDQSGIDKLRALKLIGVNSTEGVSVPPWVNATGTSDINDEVHFLQATPMILKTTFGGFGGGKGLTF